MFPLVCTTFMELYVQWRLRNIFFKKKRSKNKERLELGLQLGSVLKES